MPSPKMKRSPSKALDGYLDLVRQFPLRPIRSEKELDRAIAMINSLLDRDRRRQRHVANLDARARGRHLLLAGTRDRLRDEPVGVDRDPELHADHQSGGSGYPAV